MSESLRSFPNRTGNSLTIDLKYVRQDKYDVLCNDKLYSV